MSTPTETRKARSALTGRYERKLEPATLARIVALEREGRSTRRIAAIVGLHHATVARALREHFKRLDALYANTLAADEEFLVTVRAHRDPEVLALAAREDS